MDCIPDFCSLCLVTNPKLINILLQDNDGIVIEEKLKVFLLELVVFKPYVVKYVCDTCLEATNFIYKFKIKCVENMTTLNEYLQKFEAQTPINREKNPQEGPENRNKRKQDNFIENANRKIKTNDNSDTKRAELIIKTEVEINMETNESILEDSIVKQVDCDIRLGSNNDLKDKQSEITNNADLPSTTSPKQPITEAYNCPECHKSFKRRHHLIRHLLIHTGEKPFSCDICDKAFSQISHLIRHKHTHTGNKPFECDVCDKKFNRSDQLTTHKRIHTGAKPFKCDICEKKFNRTDQLVAHKRKHTGGGQGSRV